MVGHLCEPVGLPERLVVALALEPRLSADLLADDKRQVQQCPVAQHPIWAVIVTDLRRLEHPHDRRDAPKTRIS